MRNPAIQMLLAAVLIVAGAGISFWWAPSQILTGWAAESWPAVEGELLITDRYKESSKNGTTYYTRFEYRYRVDGKDYRGTRYSTAGDPGDTRAARDAFAERHPVGAKVEVYYDPEAPEESVMKPGVGWKSWVTLAMGLMCLLAGAWFLFRLLARRG